VKTYRGVTYYRNERDAERVRRELRSAGHTEARLVHYTRGVAVQQRRSGNYWNAERGRFE
jgi:hypothetical protein